MRLRAKLFITWSSIMILLWVGALWSIQRTMRLHIDRMAHKAFEGTVHGLAGMQRERVARMQQAGRLVMNIPELRALIAEHSSELNEDNRASLQERLDSMESTVEASFVTVLNRDGWAMAQSASAPWADAAALDQYCISTPQPMALLKRVFDGATGQEYGLWPYADHLYHVVAIPLVFGAGEIEGVLVLGQEVTDEAAMELGRSHNSQITFLSADVGVVASSLDASNQAAISARYRSGGWPTSEAFKFDLGDKHYYGLLQPVEDPASGSVVGAMLIQCDEQYEVVRDQVLRSLAAIMIGGVLAAAAVSFLVSAAITKPVRQLVSGVKRVADGDLDVALPIERRDEMGELSTAFNDMVSQLRARRNLEQKVEEAQSASRAKSQFLANMSHEIRTPLNGVIGMTELLMGTELSEQQRRYAQLVKTSGELLTALINDVLDFSKIEAGKLEIECVDFNLHDTVEEVVVLLSEKATRKNIVLGCHFHADVPRLVRGDPDRLRQVLVNLVNNAIKFTSTGSVVVRVTPHADSTGEQVSVRMSVTDTGIGIPQDRLDRLFKPFSQVDASTTRKFGGTGLGLAISKQLVELMGGAIGVESEANRGSTFWFTIKVQRQPHAAAEAADRPSVDASGLRVLAVDDSQTTRAILEEQLLSWGLRVETCGSAAEAIATLRRAAEAGQPFDVAIIDSDMTPTGGFELARTIRNDSGLGKTVLMAMLPMEAATQTAQLKQAGFAGHLTKPVRQSQLFDGIMRAVARDHASQLRGASAPAAAEASLAPAQQKRAGRILVAEDNEVNQIVARELLEKAGYQCEIVDNGRKAVEEALGGRFDLVLMDSQMPEMDGFEATKIIRQREAERGAAAGGAARIPIIALTANAIKGDREACLEVGMNAYCTKPIDSKQLLSLIDSFVGNRESRAPAATGAQAPTDVEPARGPESQIPAILVDTLLERCMNSLDTVNVVIGKFETQARRDVEQIQQSLSGHDLKTAARSAHALKGTAAIVAADRLWKIAGELERLGRAEQADDMQRQLEQLRAEVDRCIGYLPSVRSLAAERLSAAVQTV